MTDLEKFATWLADRRGISFDDCPREDREWWLWEAEAVLSESQRYAQKKESVVCPACGSPNWKWTAATLYDPKAKCGDCGHKFKTPDDPGTNAHLW